MTLTLDQIDKIGNTLIYLRENIGFLSKTKALKLLYIIEEKAVQNFGHPILNLDFEVWKLGPVDRMIFSELSNDFPEVLDSYIATYPIGNGGKKIETVNSFNDDEFCDADLELIDEVIVEFGSKDTEELIEFTHREGAPWFNKAKHYASTFWENNNSTEDRLDLSDLIINDERKSSIFREHQEHIQVTLALKS